MLNLDSYTNTTLPYNYKIVKENLINIAKYVANDFFIDKPIFKEDDFKFYFYDDFVFNTNNSSQNFITLYMEINQPKNIKTIQSKKFAKKNNLIKDLHLSLEDIKNGLFEHFVINFEANTYIWQEKYSVNLSINEQIDNENINYLVRVIPCFKYINENKKSGIYYYSNNLNDIEIEYPALSIKNFKSKNKATKNLYHFFNVIIKKLYLQSSKENNIAFEVFETLTYNVPNSLYKDNSYNTLISILNFLRNNNIRNYKTIDEQDNMFSSPYKSFSVLFAKNALSKIEKYLKKENKISNL